MSHPPRLGVGALLLVLLTLTATVAVTVLGGASADAVGHPRDPHANASPKYIAACDVSATRSSRACLLGALRDMDRARRSEHLRPTRLPSNFNRLTPAEQLFVMSNVERVDRHLTPMVGLSHTLDRYAARGARQGTDPAFPRWAREGGANWASPRNALVSDYYWVYVDGYGRFNVDCPQPGASGCWGHRHNILGRWSAPTRMGAAAAGRGTAEMFLGQDHHDRTYFTWAAEKRFLRHPITVRSLAR